MIRRAPHERVYDRDRSTPKEHKQLEGSIQGCYRTELERKGHAGMLLLRDTLVRRVITVRVSRAEYLYWFANAAATAESAKGSPFVAYLLFRLKIVGILNVASLAAPLLCRRSIGNSCRRSVGRYTLSDSYFHCRAAQPTITPRDFASPLISAGHGFESACALHISSCQQRELPYRNQRAVSRRSCKAAQLRISRAATYLVSVFLRVFGAEHVAWEAQQGDEMGKIDTGRESHQASDPGF